MTHPITPPPELVEQWRDEALNSFPDDENPCPCDIDDARDEHIATQAARWGADQELQACCEWLRSKDILEPAIEALRADRRPAPLTPWQRALAALTACAAALAAGRLTPDEARLIRAALEAQS